MLLSPTFRPYLCRHTMKSMYKRVTLLFKMILCNQLQLKYSHRMIEKHRKEDTRSSKCGLGTDWLTIHLRTTLPTTKEEPKGETEGEKRFDAL